MSSVSSGVSSSSIFGGLCSGNSRRPSMFTAKYRMREERKKVLKMSMGKVKRIEDPESFLRRSVLINNTIKILQKEVRDEKMMRHGGSYASKSSSYRKSFACSRLNEMHLSVVDEPDTEEHSSLLMDTDDDASRSSPLDNLVISKDHHNTPSLLNSRKRSLNQDDSEEDCDVQDVLSQIYVPPTPCIISSIDEDEAMLSGVNNPTPSTSAQAARSICSSSSSSSSSINNCIGVVDPLEGLTSCEPPRKKCRLDGDDEDEEDGEDEDEEVDATSFLGAVSQDCSLDDDVDVDVDVVGDSELSDWPTPPAPIIPPPTSLLLSCSDGIIPSSSMMMLSPSVTSPLSMSSLLSFSSTASLHSDSLCSSSISSLNCDRSSILNTSPYATGLGRVTHLLSDNACSDFPLMVDIPPATRDSSDSCPSPSLTVSTSSSLSPTIMSPSAMCNGLMSPLVLPCAPTGLSLPLLSPTTMSITSPPQHHCSSSSEESNSGDDEDMLLSSSETKENCSLHLSLPLSGLHSPLVDHNSRSSNSGGDISASNGGGYVNGINVNASSINGNNAVINNNSNINSSSSSTGNVNSSSEMEKNQQYSSCGHSSIFGELQSVVFHSLIASLET
ncbi:uncharacterized protein LOC110842896 [Folsomia candida]|nr:uncharacterized protein LOC110842896 [Folsomia candida]